MSNFLSKTNDLLNPFHLVDDDSSMYRGCQVQVSAVNVSVGNKQNEEFGEIIMNVLHHCTPIDYSFCLELHLSGNYQNEPSAMMKVLYYWLQSQCGVFAFFHKRNLNTRWPEKFLRFCLLFGPNSFLAVSYFW